MEEGRKEGLGYFWLATFKIYLADVVSNKPKLQNELNITEGVENHIAKSKPKL